jgi:hypothetical protein
MPDRAGQDRAGWQPSTVAGPPCDKDELIMPEQLISSNTDSPGKTVELVWKLHSNLRSAR